MEQETIEHGTAVAAEIDESEVDAGELVDELLIEEISIDGMCGVY